MNGFPGDVRIPKIVLDSSDELLQRRKLSRSASLRPKSSRRVLFDLNPDYEEKRGTPVDYGLRRGTDYNIDDLVGRSTSNSIRESVELTNRARHCLIGVSN